MDAANRSRPDFSNDPVLNLSKKTYEDMDLIAGGFGDCSAETTINQNTINAHIPEYERCQRVVDQSADCEVVHDYDASVVKHYDGPYNLKSCGDGCTELWIGKVGDDYWLVTVKSMKSTQESRLVTRMLSFPQHLNMLSGMITCKCGR